MLLVVEFTPETFILPKQHIVLESGQYQTVAKPKQKQKPKEEEIHTLHTSEQWPVVTKSLHWQQSRFEAHHCDTLSQKKVFHWMLLADVIFGQRKEGNSW